MKVMVANRSTIYNNQPVETYGRSMVRELRRLGHEVIEVPKRRLKNENAYKGVDLFLDIDCGRDKEGSLGWHCQEERVPCPSAVYFIDSHGHPDNHLKASRQYDHVFFAVWAKRDLFANHFSAHWCPNFTDTKWFDGMKYQDLKETRIKHQFGFFGSKGGLDRAKPLIDICNNNGWTHHVGQICPGGKHQWPATAEAMARCAYLFNHQQKHDGPNLRVMESMLMLKPLICDNDPQSGMDKLFTPNLHYIPYESYTYKGLEEAMKWVIDNPKEAGTVAQQGYQIVLRNHLVKHRIHQMMEVING